MRKSTARLVSARAPGGRGGVSGVSVSMLRYGTTWNAGPKARAMQGFGDVGS